MEWEPVIGLEIHAELNTKTKMFCSCLNDPEEKIPNTNICPVCLAHPGTLPIINKKAVEYVVKVGLTLNSHIPEYSKFDRKNYFYPDLPKGYQISQYDEPICQGGELSLYLSNDEEERKKKIKITRVHLEEDVGKIIHLSSQGKPTSTLIDYNRAGIPLMELVTEPVIRSGQEARLFAQGLQVLLRSLNVSKANMEKGEMRCEVNISLRPKDSEKLGTKVEIKNLNSFRAVEQAVDFEIRRQKNVLEEGGVIRQETRGWDAQKGVTYSQRSKEEAKDYRYLPEPDLPPLHLYSGQKEGGLFDLKQLRGELPELPWQKKERLMKEYGLNSVQANAFLRSSEELKFFEKTNQYIGQSFEEVKLQGDKQEIKIRKSFLYKLIADYTLTDILGILLKEHIQWNDIKLTPRKFAYIINSLSRNEISSRVAKDVIYKVVKNGGNPEEIIQREGLKKITSTNDLEPLVKNIIKNNEKAVADYKKGKENVLKFLVGQAMAQTKGAADPKVLEKLFKESL